jgi:hypothetical protein
MAKAKKSAKKDTASFIKKVASAGRGGDTELAYLSPKARELLKKLGGAGTKNPKTKLREYQPVFGMEALGEGEEPLGLFGDNPMMPAPRSEVVAPPFPGFSVAPDTMRTQVEPESEPPVAAQPGSAAADLQQFAPPAYTPPRVYESPGAPPSPVYGRPSFLPPVEEERDYIPRPRTEAAPVFEPAASPPTTSGMAMSADAAERARLRRETREQEDLLRPPFDGGVGNRPQKQDSVEAFIREQEERDRVPRTENDEPITAPGSAADNLAQFTGTSPTTTLTPEQLAELARINAAGFGGLTTGINLSGIGLGGSYMPGGPGPRPEEGDIARFRDEQLRQAAQEEEARRAAEAEAARKAAEEEARRKAEEDARRVADEATRRAAEETARRAAEEEAARRAMQDAAAARAAEEARRLAEENARRMAAEEAARRAAEEARRRAEEEQRNRPPPREEPPPGGGTGGGTGTAPPGLIDSKLPVNPPTTRPPKDEMGPVRTADFIDRNLNGIDDRDEKPDTGTPARGGFNFNWNAIDPNSDVGRLLGRIGKPPAGREPRTGRGTPGGGRTPPPQTGGGRPAPAPTPAQPPVNIPVSPPATGIPGGGYIPTANIPTPGYIANPLPVAPGQGTSTPYFTPTPGALSPGTLPSSTRLPSLQTSNLPLQALAANPNLGPTMLGGAQNAGYYTDRFGNIILSPGAVRPTGRAKGGPSSDAELLALLKGDSKDSYAESMKNIDSARGMLESLSESPGETQVEFDATPVSQTVRRATRRPINKQTDRGTAKGMAMELESLTAAQEPRRAPDTLEELLKMSESVRSRDAMSAKDLMRDTFGEGRLTKKQLSRLGDLMTRRFNEGGEVDETDERIVPLHIRTYLESMSGESSKRTEPITEASLSGAELAKLRRLIELAKTRPVSDRKTGKALPNTVTYAHHDAYKDRYERLGGLPGPDTDRSLFSTANLRNTLGTFSFKEMPDGSYVVKDTYDFTGDVNEKDNFFIRKAKQAGVSRPVQIVVPALKERTGDKNKKTEPKRRAKGSPSTGETSADLYRSLLERSDLSRSIPTSPPSGAPIKQPDLREEGVGFNPDLTFADKLVGAGLGLYGRNVNREDLPLHKRIFLESVVDARKDPITEASMKEPERQALMSVVRSKYKSIEPDLTTYEKYLVKSLASHQKAVAAKNKGKILYPEFFAQYKKDLDAIKQYKKGVITQDFIDLASGDSQTYEREVGLRSAGVADVANIFSIGPNLGYEDYLIDALKNPSDPSGLSVFGSHTPVALNRTFGRIGYTVDPKTKQLVFQENYDFNPLPPGYKGSTEGHLAGASEGGGDPLYKAIRLYAGKVLPPGQGRPVNVRLNQLPNAPQNLPDEGSIQAIRQRLGMNED